MVPLCNSKVDISFVPVNECPMVACFAFHQVAFRSLCVKRSMKAWHRVFCISLSMDMLINTNGMHCISANQVVPAVHPQVR